MKRWILLALLLALLLPASAQAESMTIRFYILPIERNGNTRGPKYFAWRYDPDPPGLADAWSILDYGLIDMGVLVSDITDTDHTFLAAQADVFSFPVDLDVTMTAAERSTLSTYLEAHGVPGDWVSAQDTWRTALRTVSGMFLYMQRLTALAGSSPLDWGYNLNTQWRNISASHQTEMTDAATSLGYDVSFIRNTTQIRALLKTFSDAWGNQTIYMGMTTL